MVSQKIRLSQIKILVEFHGSSRSLDTGKITFHGKSVGNIKYMFTIIDHFSHHDMSHAKVPCGMKFSREFFAFRGN